MHYWRRRDTWRAFAGALIIIPLQELSNNLFDGINGVNMIVYGSLIVLFVVFCRDGIYGMFVRKLKGVKK